MEAVFYFIIGCVVLLLPGFLLTLMIYPKPGQLDFLERMAVSLGLSVLVLIYMGFVLAHPGLGMLRSGPFFGAFFVVCFSFAVVARWRGGFEVFAAYWRRVAGALQKLKPPKPVPPMEKPVVERPAPKVPEEKAPVEEKPKETAGEGVPGGTGGEGREERGVQA